MAGLMDKLFGTGARPQQQQQPPGPGGIPHNTGMAPQGTTTVAANGVTPTVPPRDPAVVSGSEANKSPLSEFEKLWEPATGPDGKPLQVTADPLYQVDAQKVMQEAQKVDFRKVATPEQLQKVSAGGQEGVAAMMEIMQSVASSVYGSAALAATTIAERGITKALSQAEQRLPGMIRQQSFNESLANKNPALHDPAVKPMIEMLSKQLGQKYPNATAEELTGMAERYMQAAADAFNPAKQVEAQKQQQQQQKENDNWDVFFGQQAGGSPFNF